ncbi:MAG: hypothetical protein COV59_03815 [Candidatus Magasanikbacteria bacterium CG11_big_fil_rev_8_21_14_0_20_39_34]|uniref:Uncharacterized protein n=1 Tax=Candidatus Magasanikbacteria bacterium CG11_big_fil_rev_8_21_14_0_20_39_34 TaxID=1974653 RepID=A0A2H0N4F7_9BACT|nr:MAG: hypothetical protein COV59_03815 [Candidatus Magasanikbacteria bacterium CG11_big_fil_rev_8_21_14_0_20_39_34]
MTITTADMKFKFKFRDDIDFPASMTLLIGQFEVRGFTVRKSKYPNGSVRHTLYPPSKNVGGAKWLHIFYVPNKEDWAKIERAALDAFYAEFDDHLMHEMNTQTNNQIDDIEF